MPLLAQMKDRVRAIVTNIVPLSARQRIRSLQRKYRIQAVRVGTVRFGDLNRLDPISPIFGKDRDLLSVERYYIEKFLDQHAMDIRGRTLEMGDREYTTKFGGVRVSTSDVLHYVEGNPLATIVADLTAGDNIESDSFDCIIITQTLQMIYDTKSAIGTLHRILKPGGVVLATTHGMSRVARREGVDDWGEYWHFTSQSCRKLFGEFFDVQNVEVTTYGNVMSCIANLHGLGAREITAQQIDHFDPNYELLIGVRATKRP
jgi:SAM-dependent methyltransferase